MSGKTCADRNAGIDILKYLCAFLVICVHIDFEGRYYVEPLIRSAVPVFFMITGWFYTDDGARQKKQILKILKIFLGSCAFYLLLGLIRESSPGEYISSLFTGKSLTFFALFNHVTVEIHLWYLAAVVYVLIIAAMVGQRGRRLLCWMIPLLLAAALALGAYSPLLLGKKYMHFVGRNFLFTGLPCFLLGEHIGRNRHKLRVRPAALLVLLCLSMALAILEGLFIKVRTGYENADLYLGAVFMAVTMLLLASVEFPGSLGGVGRTLAAWGRNYSLGIYVLHIAVIDLIQQIFGPLFGRSYLAGKIYYCTAPLLVLIVSTALTALLKAAKRRLLPSKTK